jgi:hypothetical protein
MFKPMDTTKILSNHRLTMAVLGISKKSFEELLVIFTQTLIDSQNSKKRKRSIGGGRKGNIKSPEQKLFFILFYLKNYPTFDVCAYIFASSKTRTNGWFLKILPILEKTLGRKMVLPQRRINSIEEFYRIFPGIEEVMIDGVERPTQRPKKPKGQTKHYSGKKKRHTRKNVIVTNKSKKVLLLTPTKHGRVHDKKMSDKYSIVSHIPPKVGIFADSGFQGIQKQHKNVLMPIKGSKKKPLTELDRWYNTQVSRVRITVEHAISGMKRFRSYAEKLRNKAGIDDMMTHVVAGLWNLQVDS